MSNVFEDHYQKVMKIIQNFNNIKQSNEANKLIKQMENQMALSSSSAEKAKMKKLINECRFKLKEAIEEAQLMMNKSKCDITANESSMNQFINNPLNNTLHILNAKKGMFQELKEEIEATSSQQVELQERNTNNSNKENKQETINAQTNNSSWSLKKIICIAIILVIVIAISISIAFVLIDKL